MSSQPETIKTASALKQKTMNRPQILIHTLSILFGLAVLLPMISIISASFTSEFALADKGFGLWPSEFDLKAYEYIFANPNTIIRSYIVTIFVTVTHTAVGVLLMLMVGYVTARENCSFRRPLTFFLFFTMLFSGGIVPTYVLLTQYLHLKNTYWVMILPSLIYPFYVIMIRTFVQQQPKALFESLKIDGAGEFRVFFNIVVPLSTPVIATVAFFVARNKWNDWQTGLYYLSDKELYPLQYMLWKIQNDLQSLRVAMQNEPWLQIDPQDIPGTNLLMAMAVLATVPMMLAFPLFQKYYVRGLTVGSIKG